MQKQKELSRDVDTRYWFTRWCELPW